MTSRRPAHVLSALALAAAMLATGPAANAAHAAQSSAADAAVPSASDDSCTSTKLSASVAIRTRSGAKIGSAQMFVASGGVGAGFCVRINPVKGLRKITTQAYLPHRTYFPDGDRSSSGLVGGSGAWKHAFLVTGSDFGPGYSMKATAKIVVPGGPSGKAKLEGTLP